MVDQLNLGEIVFTLYNPANPQCIEEGRNIAFLYACINGDEEGLSQLLTKAPELILK